MIPLNLQKTSLCTWKWRDQKLNLFLETRLLWLFRKGYVGSSITWWWKLMKTRVCVIRVRTDINHAVHVHVGHLFTCVTLTFNSLNTDQHGGYYRFCWCGVDPCFWKKNKEFIIIVTLNYAISLYSVLHVIRILDKHPSILFRLMLKHTNNTYIFIILSCF